MPAQATNQSPREDAGPQWGPSQRVSLIRELGSKRRVWDLIVVGAGITGAGIARDAAMRGLSVLVVEAGDVAYGTSSRSTRLIHGGVRYLEHGEVGLVYEALRERSRLYEAAPHLVAPAHFVFPSYRGDRLAPWRLRVGLTLYDTLNFFRGTPHTYLPPEVCEQVEPLLNPENLRGAVQYEDAVTDDARLTLTVLQSARRHGAQVLTHAAVERIDGKPGAHCVHLSDGLEIATRQAVVATGPWTGGKLLGQVAKGVLALSKGVHLVMRSSHIPVRHPVVIQAPNSKRILFVVPWGTRTYLGTSDVPFEGDPGRCGVTQAEELELLTTISRVLPNAELRHENIVSAWSGVRPLVRPEGSEHNTSTVELSRKHRTITADNGVLGLVGGKLTTFRSMAEELVDMVVERLRENWPSTRALPGPCTTHQQPLVPGEPLAAAELEDPIIADLAPRHGPLARTLARRARGDSALAQRLVHDLPYRRVELDHAIRFEGVEHVNDLIRRRLPLVLTDTRMGGEVAREIAAALVDARGGSQSDIDEEIERYVEAVYVETRRRPDL